MWGLIFGPVPKVVSPNRKWCRCFTFHLLSSDGHLPCTWHQWGQDLSLCSLFYLVFFSCLFCISATRVALSSWAGISCCLWQISTNHPLSPFLPSVHFVILSEFLCQYLISTHNGLISDWQIAFDPGDWAMGSAPTIQSRILSRSLTAADLSSPLKANTSAEFQWLENFLSAANSAGCL